MSGAKVFGQWRPATHPPDGGQDVIVFAPDAHQQVFTAHRIEGPPGEFDWYPGCDHLADPIDVEITHWMPLPVPPHGSGGTS